MEDAKYINECTHRITCDRLTITDNGDNTFSAILPYPAITNKALTFIRTYNDEKAYLQSGADYTTLLNYSYRTVTGGMDELPIAGIVREIGITNYEFVSPTEIVFGTIPGDPTIDKIVVDDALVPQPIYLIDYNVQEGACPMCEGTGAKQDIEFGGTGEVQVSTGHEKIVERVLKALLTAYGESAEDLLFGSALDNIIGSEIDVTTIASIQKAVYDTIQYLINLQSGVDLNEDEIITGVSSVTIENDKDIPTKINIKVVVKDYYGDEVPCIVSLRAN